MNTYLFYGVIFLAGGWGYFLGYRRGMKTPEKSALLSSMDLTFSKSAVQEGIRSLGYALVPTSDNDAVAMDNGYNAIKADGKRYALVVSLVAMGMAVYYVREKEKSELFSLNLISNINNLVADEFRLNSSLLWDSRGKALRVNENAKSLMEEVSKKGFSACHEFKNSGTMTKTLLEVVASEHLN